MEKFLFVILLIGWLGMIVYSMVIRNWDILLSASSHVGVMAIAFVAGFKKGKEEV